MAANLRKRTNGVVVSDSSPTKPVAAPPAPLEHSHSHSHSHHHGSSGAEEAAALLSALGGNADAGSRITLIGLGANVGLTVTKGVAGYALGSAALLADAAHSGTDLLSDIVTLTTYRMSRRSPSASYPYGYGKYESMGSLIVSCLLVAAGLGIGLHSYHLLMETLAALPFINKAFLASLTVLPKGGHGHEEEEAEIVDARAMLFAGAAVLIKEYLYRITLKVAKEEHSNVLLANALHHRSDAFGSLVALIAIAGAWFGFPILDPLGGLLVSGMILRNGSEVGLTALKELVDQTSDLSLVPKVHSLLLSLRDPTLPSLPAYDSTSSSPAPVPASPNPHPSLPILSISSIRVFNSGPSFLLDIGLVLPSELTLAVVNEIEEVVRKECTEVLGGKARCREVVIRVLGGAK